VAAALAERLAAIDPPNADFYRARHEDFAARWQSAVERWTARLAPVNGMQIVVHHRAWVYLAAWAGLEEVGALEAKPGLPPSAAHLAQLLALVNTRDVRLIIRAAYKDDRASEWLSERTGIPHTVIPHTVDSVPEATDLFAMFDFIVETLVGAAS
jgi:zinc/manganese transport system substrate-binding protein